MVSWRLVEDEGTGRAFFLSGSLAIGESVNLTGRFRDPENASAPYVAPFLKEVSDSGPRENPWGQLKKKSLAPGIRAVRSAHSEIYLLGRFFPLSTLSSRSRTLTQHAIPSHGDFRRFVAAFFSPRN